MIDDALLAAARAVGDRLRARGQSIGVAESSTGGIVSAALLAVPGASAYFRGCGVIYTRAARIALLGITDADMAGMRSASEPYALLLADTVIARLGSDWALAETGAAGPTGNRYGDAAGHVCLAVAGPGVRRALTIETGSADRAANMQRFAAEAFALLADALG
jgi:PncC family amidohydrolase